MDNYQQLIALNEERRQRIQNEAARERRAQGFKQAKQQPTTDTQHTSTVNPARSLRAYVK